MKLYYESKPGELEHGLFKKIFTPKYLKKIPNGKGGYRYLYTKEEIDAYNKKNAERRANAVSNRQTSVANRRDEAYRTNSNSQTPYVSKEYLEELEYNSQKNKYPNKTNTSQQTTSRESRDTSTTETRQNKNTSSNTGSKKTNTIDPSKGRYYFDFDKETGRTVVRYYEDEKKKKKK